MQSESTLKNLGAIERYSDGGWMANELHAQDMECEQLEINYREGGADSGVVEEERGSERGDSPVKVTPPPSPIPCPLLYRV